MLARLLVDTVHGQGLAQPPPTVRADYLHSRVERPIDYGGPLLGVEIGFSCHSNPLVCVLSIQSIVHKLPSAQPGSDPTAARGTLKIIATLSLSTDAGVSNHKSP